MKRNNDRMILEHLIKTYGKNNIISIINESAVTKKIENMIKEYKYIRNEENLKEYINVIEQDPEVATAILRGKFPRASEDAWGNKNIIELGYRGNTDELVFEASSSRNEYSRDPRYYGRTTTNYEITFNGRYLAGDSHTNGNSRYTKAEIKNICKINAILSYYQRKYNLSGNI